MKSGIELIAEERREQIEKHGRSIKYDVENNSNYELLNGAMALMSSPEQDLESSSDLMWELALKDKWSKKIFDKMVSKPYKDRLIIAGALIAAEIDRLQNNKNKP